jgi:hypothetical protein
VIGDEASVESGSVPQVDSQLVPEEAEQQSRNEYGLEADDAAQEVAAPNPAIAFEVAEDGSSDQVPA